MIKLSVKSLYDLGRLLVAALMGLGFGGTYPLHAVSFASAGKSGHGHKAGEMRQDIDGWCGRLREEGQKLFPERVVGFRLAAALCDMSHDWLGSLALGKERDGFRLVALGSNHGSAHAKALQRIGSCW